jgi:GntR family transcriptional repressor for pyruvate dehydrogenase complex
MKIDPNSAADLSAQIAKAIRDAIVSGALIVDERLPSEAELAEQFDVSRPTVREALKRLAAQSLIRTQRGAFGGAFVNRLSYEDAYNQQITTSTLLLSMNGVSFDVACEARFAHGTRLRAAGRPAPQRRSPRHHARRNPPPGAAGADGRGVLRLGRGVSPGARGCAGNPVLSYQLAGAVEAMQPLMNMITFTARSREEIVALHARIADAAEARDGVPA